ncbi:MAG: hypothetical protein NC416_15935 [Eubacterium sp.]|nr:hypothetical protein [Eubacterium sp.]
MDTFIDKLAQKRNAQEMIYANMTAEALKMEQLQEQMRAYDGLMQEIRQVNLKTVENVTEVQGVLKECIAKLEAMQESDRQDDGREQELAQIKELLEEKFKQSDEFLHRENVKVYRNVQAAVTDELNKQTEVLQSEKVPDNNGIAKAALVISIITMLGVIANIAMQLFSITISF